MLWLFCVLLFQLFSAENKVSNTEEKCYFDFVNIISSGEDFFMI